MKSGFRVALTDLQVLVFLAYLIDSYEDTPESKKPTISGLDMIIDTCQDEVIASIGYFAKVVIDGTWRSKVETVLLNSEGSGQKHEAIQMFFSRLLSEDITPKEALKICSETLLYHAHTLTGGDVDKLVEAFDDNEAVIKSLEIQLNL